jgi:hydroxymethylpyrimidine pyrophosphatase-like HAD family hydrolase
MPIKAAFLDIDHTLLDGSGELHPGLAEVLHPDSRTIDITHLTARTPINYAAILHQHTELIPSDDMPVGLEYGTRIITAADYTNTATYQTAHREALSSDELATIIDMASLAVNQLRITFMPQDNNKPRVLWHSAQDSVSTLEGLIDTHRPGHVSYRIINGQRVSEQMSPLHTYTHSYGGGTTVDIIPKHTGKQHAALRMMKMCSLQPNEVLIAGDSPADYGMLAIEGVLGVIVSGVKADLATMPIDLSVVPPHLAAQFLKNYL